MGKVISVLNQKGGVGKTTISAHLATCLENDGYDVLLVDTDDQASLRDWSSATDDRTVSVKCISKEDIKNDIPLFKKKFDFVIMDCRPHAGRETGIIIRQSDIVLIPVQASALDIWSTQVITDAIEARQEVTDGLPIARFVLNRAKHNTILANDAKEAMAQIGIKLIGTTLHDREDFKKTIGIGKTVMTYPSEAQREFLRFYNDFVQEVLSGEYKAKETN